MLLRLLLVLVSVLVVKSEDRLPAQNFLLSPQWQQLLQNHVRWNEARAELSDDYADAPPAPRRFLRATDLLKALSDKRNFINQVRQTRFKDSAYSPALTPSGRPYGTPLRWG